MSSSGKWELMLEGRYYFSYGDIMRNSAVYAGNPVRSPLDNISLSLGFFYRLGDKPHTPLPPPWYARIIAKREAKRAQQELEEMKKTEETAGIGEITEEETTAVAGKPRRPNNRYGGYRGRSGRDNNGRVWNRQDKAR